MYMSLNIAPLCSQVAGLGCSNDIHTSTPNHTSYFIPNLSTLILTTPHEKRSVLKKSESSQKEVNKAHFLNDINFLNSTKTNYLGIGYDH